MSTQLKTIEPIKPEVIKRLAARAEESGENVNEFLSRLLDGMEEGAENSKPLASSMTPQKKPRLGESG